MPSIINFQESRRKCPDLINELEKLGYECSLLEKDVAEDEDIDTQLTAWKNERFEKVHMFPLDLCKPDIHSAQFKKNASQILLLKDKYNENEAVVNVNSHILSIPGRGGPTQVSAIGLGAPKLLQLFLLIKSIHLISQQCGEDFSVNIVWGGTFNFTANSPIYQILTKGDLKLIGLPQKKLSGEFYSKDTLDAALKDQKIKAIQTLNLGYKLYILITNDWGNI